MIPSAPATRRSRRTASPRPRPRSRKRSRSATSCPRRSAASRKWVRTGRLEEAESLYREALESTEAGERKGFAEAHAGLGIMLIDAERWAEGAEHIKVARKQNGLLAGHLRRGAGSDPRQEARQGENPARFRRERAGVGQGEDLYHRGLAIYYIASNDLKAAETEALTALHLNPSDPRHGKLVALVYEKRNVPALAINACEEVLRTPGFTPTASFLHYTGTLYQKAERYNEARDKYVKRWSSTRPTRRCSRISRGCSRLAKQYDRARRCTCATSSPNPTTSTRRSDWSESLSEAGRYKQALDAANQAMEADSTRCDVRIAYARAAIRAAATRRPRRGRWRCTRRCRTVLACTPKDHTLLAALPDRHAAARPGAPQSQPGDRGAIRPTPRRTSRWACCTSRPASGFGHHAISGRRSVTIPKMPLYFLNLGVAHFQMKRLDKSIPAFRSAMALDQKLVIGSRAARSGAGVGGFAGGGGVRVPEARSRSTRPTRRRCAGSDSST